MDKATAEIHRVLVHGGRAFIAVHHPDMLQERLQIMAAEFGIPPQAFDGVLRSIAPAFSKNPNDLVRLAANVFDDLEEGNEFFKKQGFRVVESDEMRDKTRKKDAGLAYWFLIEKPKE